MLFKRIIGSLFIVILIPFYFLAMPSPHEMHLSEIRKAFNGLKLPEPLLLLACEYHDEDNPQPINIIDLAGSPLVEPCSYVYDHTPPPAGILARFHRQPRRLSSIVNIAFTESGELDLLLTDQSRVRISIPDGKFLYPELGNVPANQILLFQEGHCFVASSLIGSRAENQCYTATVIDNRRDRSKITSPMPWVDPRMEYEEWYKGWQLGAGQPRTKIEVCKQSLAKMLGFVALKNAR